MIDLFMPHSLFPLYNIISVPSASKVTTISEPTSGIGHIPGGLLSPPDSSYTNLLRWGWGWGLCLLSPSQQLCSRGEGKTLVHLLLGDGSRCSWWPQLVLEVESRIHLAESNPAFCVVLGVLAPNANAATAGSSN
jgi:hypothetical protein